MGTYEKICDLAGCKKGGIDFTIEGPSQVSCFSVHGGELIVKRLDSVDWANIVGQERIVGDNRKPYELVDQSTRDSLKLLGEKMGSYREDQGIAAGSTFRLK